MSGRRREGLAPNLFPFLAVLVCTLGTLILLLALVAQNAGDTYAAADSQPPAEDAGPDEEAVKLVEAAEMIDRQLREAMWHRDQTVKMRDEQTAELEERRDRLAHLEDHVRRLHDDLKSLTTEVEKAMEKPGESSEVQATLDKVLLEIEAEKEAIGNLETELKSETPRIVIVPHKGPNGTDRRPIYIECRADGVYLQPGNQHINRDDLEPRVGFANPLESALRTIRLHAMQSYGDAIAPYPLLVVRPDGIESYSVARAAMSNWDDQFGYELVPGEVDLAFPSSDPTLNTKVAAAIDQAVAQRQALAMRFGGGGGSGAGGGRNASGGGDPRSAGYSAGDGSPDGQYSGGPNAGGGYSSLAGDGTANGDAAMNGTGGDTAAAGRSAASPPASSLPVLSAAKMSRGATSGAIGDARMAGFTPPPVANAVGPYDGNGPDGDPTGPSGTASGSPGTKSGSDPAIAMNSAARQRHRPVRHKRKPAFRKDSPPTGHRSVPPPIRVTPPARPDKAFPVPLRASPRPRPGSRPDRFRPAPPAATAAPKRHHRDRRRRPNRRLRANRKTRRNPPAVRRRSRWAIRKRHLSPVSARIGRCRRTFRLAAAPRCCGWFAWSATPTISS
jgi:hypothetical protein